MWDMISVATQRRADFAREVEQHRRSIQSVDGRRARGRGRRAIGQAMIRAGEALAEPVNADRV